MFAVCDHYEPLWASATPDIGLQRVKIWHDRYPKLMGDFRDADGRGPQHSFFFPGEEYRPEYFDLLDKLIRQGAGEVELHLHHEQDTEATLLEKIEAYLELYAQRGHLTRAADGRYRYAFIHGDWALANGRPDGRNCGVNAELPLLFSTGCYADLTFPSCPDITQPNQVNVIYWPVGDLRQARSYENGRIARVGESYDDRILIITGPLAIALGRKGRPRIEYSALQASDPPTAQRVRNWVKQGIHVLGRPEWIFVKVHTHGAQDKQAAVLLGEHGYMLHRELAAHYNDGKGWLLHYVTARELYNIARAAMDGRSGNPNEYRDYLLPPPPIRTGSRD
jgi:hypothetical protein